MEIMYTHDQNKRYSVGLADKTSNHRTKYRRAISVTSCWPAVPWRFGSRECHAGTSWTCRHRETRTRPNVSARPENTSIWTQRKAPLYYYQMGLWRNLCKTDVIVARCAYPCKVWNLWSVLSARNSSNRQQKNTIRKHVAHFCRRVRPASLIDVEISQPAWSYHMIVYQTKDMIPVCEI